MTERSTTRSYGLAPAVGPLRTIGICFAVLLAPIALVATAAACYLRLLVVLACMLVSHRRRRLYWLRARPLRGRGTHAAASASG